MESQRDTILDFIRGMGIIIVVCGHAMQINLVQGNSNMLWEYIKTFQMPLLFFVSGYTVGFSYPCDDCKRYIVQKAKRLLVPYIMWAEIFYALCCILGYDVWSIKSAILSLASSPFWFLRHLIIYFVVISISNIILNLIVNTLFDDSLKLLLSVVLPCLGGVFVVGLRTTLFLNQANAVWQYLWFLGGYDLFVLIKKKERIKKYLWNNKTFIISTGVTAALFLIYKYFRTNEYTICVFSVLSVFLFFGNLSEICGEKINVFVGEIGRSTLPIYAIHWCILFAPNLYINWYVKLLNTDYYVVNIVLTISIWLLICIITIWLLRMNKVTRRVLLGEK